MSPTTLTGPDKPVARRTSPLPDAPPCEGGVVGTFSGVKDLHKRRLWGLGGRGVGAVWHAFGTAVHTCR